MNAQIITPQFRCDEREAQLREAVEHEQWLVDIAIESLHAAIRELEDYRRAHAKCEVF